MTATVQRKTWSSDETELLIKLWDEIGSIVVLSILLNRSTSSVQTQASRIGLPRRSEHTNRHRRRWSRSEESLFQESLADATFADGRIDIYEIAQDLNRSVDAIAAKLQENYNSEPELLAALEIPDDVRDKVKEAKTLGSTEKRYKLKGEIKDTRYSEKMRNCLMCSSPFWSEGAHNRVCDKCKRAHGGGDDGAD